MGQEYMQAEENSYNYVSERIDHIEAMVRQFTKTTTKVKSSIRQFFRHYIFSNISKQKTSLSDESRAARGGSLCPTNSAGSQLSISSPSQQKLNESFSLSHYLYSILPEKNTAMMIFTHANYIQMPIHRFRRSKNQQDCEAQKGDLLLTMSRRPPPTAPPVVFAQKLYRLALAMRQLDPTTTYKTKRNSRERVHDASRRFFEIAQHVTAHDTLMESLDGLEVLLLESGYHVNAGNHRASWLSLRRALGLAELMGLREKGMSSDASAESLWYLLNYCDRFISVMFGLPCNSYDDSFAADRVLEDKNPEESLSRTHVAIIGRIIARNLQMASCIASESLDNSLLQCYKQTQDIDKEVKQAATILPIDSWATPNLNHSQTDDELKEKTSMLRLQMHHSYLLLLLHIPYFLRRFYHGRLSEMDTGIDYTYSKAVALSASRDMLARFLPMRDIHHTPSYRGVDHKAWLAAAILLLSHINTDHKTSSNDSLEHQRPQDLAIIHRLIQRFDLQDPTDDYGQQLHSLLDIEATGSSGTRYDLKWSGNCTTTSTNDEATLQFPIPYFGTISIFPSKSETPPFVKNYTNFINSDSQEPQLTQYTSLSNSGNLDYSTLISPAFRNQDLNDDCQFEASAYPFSMNLMTLPGHHMDDLHSQIEPIWQDYPTLEESMDRQYNSNIND